MTVVLLGLGIAIYRSSLRSDRRGIVLKGTPHESPLDELLDLYNADAPLEEAYTIPAPWYLDERIEQAEREQVFGRNWIAVGRLDQVAAEGQFFTVEIAGEPLVVVRGADGELRAFLQRVPASCGGGGERALRNGAASALSRIMAGRMGWMER